VLWASVDDDESGEVDFKEFLSWMKTEQDAGERGHLEGMGKVEKRSIACKDPCCAFLK